MTTAPTRGKEGCAERHGRKLESERQEKKKRKNGRKNKMIERYSEKERGRMKKKKDP